MNVRFSDAWAGSEWNISSAGLVAKNRGVNTMANDSIEPSTELMVLPLGLPKKHANRINAKHIETIATELPRSAGMKYRATMATRRHEKPS